MKRTLEWHRNGIRNATAYAKRLRDNAELAIRQAELMEEECRFRAAQIERAEREARESFDAQTFNKPRRLKALEGREP